ncbi:MAG: DUF5103 domain-containing protein [Muribaculaceae bacterium]|nr:DUF5103 domain-containing protein [Muribaculaceae bacterium]
MTIRNIITYLFICIAGMVWAIEPGDDTRQGVNDPSFRSLQVTVDGNVMSIPVITLGGPEQIVISFDELGDDRRYMRYELIHCDARWRPEGLVDSEFLDGFNMGDVVDYRFSEATLVPYTHYQIALPNEQVRFTASGNYLVRVYPEDDPNEVLLQARFSVLEPLTEVKAGVTTTTDVDVNGSHQQVEIAVDAGDYPIEDMFNDLIVVVEQDGRQDNSVIVSQPLRLAGPRRAIYEHLRPLIFDAGNEYRRFEMVSLSRPQMNVEQIVYQDPYYHATLAVDQPRAATMYQYDRTQNGRYLVRESDSPSEDSDVLADYIVTYFALDMPEQQDYDIFIDGDLVNRRIDPTSLMTFNRATGLYEKVLLLKQGAYNYQYIAVPRGTGSTRGLTSVVEGDYAPTIHQYTVKVYHRPRGTRYDRLIGLATVFSGS